MRPKIVGDPFGLLLDVFSELYPDKTANIYWTDKKSLRKGTGENRALGVTEFPDNGEIPEIYVCADQTLIQAMDIMAHELAHVAAGTKAEHGPKWEDCYKAIYERYHQIMDGVSHGS